MVWPPDFWHQQRLYIFAYFSTLTATGDKAALISRKIGDSLRYSFDFTVTAPPYRP
jgi:hypothetical protein